MSQPKEAPRTLIANHRQKIDRNVRTLLNEMERGNTAVPVTPAGQFDRALKAYRRVRPLLTLITTLPLIPSRWRVALQVFTQELDALVLAAPEVRAQFKAGRDL